jgi:iron(III) transport system substrate-binding protein
MAALILTEGSSSPADLFFSQDAGALGAVEEASLFATLPSETLSLVESKYSSQTGNWVGTSGRARVVVYNPSLVDTPPAGIDDLLDPKWSGKIGYAPTNASWQSFVTALRVTRGEDAARAWLKGFAANKPVAYEKNGVVRDAVNSGEVALGLVNHYYLFEKIVAEGAAAVVAKNHYFTNGDIGGLVNVAGVGMLQSSKNQKSTLALINYLLSPAGQNYFAQKSYEYPLVAGIAQYAELPALADLNLPNIDLSDLKSIALTQEMLEEVGLLTK